MNRGVATRSQTKRDTQEKMHMTERDAQGLGDNPADNMRAVVTELRDFRVENKTALHNLKEEIKDDMKKELQELKQEIYQKLSENAARIQSHETRLNEAETRINDIESANMVIKDALAKSLERQRAMQEKLTDLEGRSRRNNMRIYGVPEGAEGNSVSDFVEQLPKTELTVKIDLHIQHAHRALARKPERFNSCKPEQVNSCKLSRVKCQRNNSEKSLGLRLIFIPHLVTISEHFLAPITKPTTRN